MELPSNRFTHAIAADEAQIGLCVSLCSNLAAALLKAGFTFVATATDTGLLARAADSVLAQTRGALP